MKRAALGVLLGFSLTVILGVAWNATYETLPTGATLASELDTIIQDLKKDIRKRFSVELQVGTTTSDDNGLMRPGSARAFAQNGAPTDIQGPGAYNSSADSFTSTLLQTDEIGAVTQDLGVGRLWVDLDGLDTGTTALSDNNQLNVWDTTTNLFVPVTAQSSSGSGIGARNQIYNGSFEVTDGTGLVASTTVAAGWTNVLTATIAYASVANSTEGDGLIMRTTGAGNPLEGASQVLAGLKESKTYVYRARVRATAGDTCTLSVTDGTTSVTDVSATTAVFETLEVEHTTTAGPADVTVGLFSTADTDVCDWDHVTAFEKNATVDQPGIQAIYTTDIVTDTGVSNVFTDTPILTTSITMPGPAYIVTIDASISVLSPSDNMMAVLLKDDCAAGAFTAVTPVYAGGDSGVGTPVHQTMAINFVDNISSTRVAPGATCRYQVQVRDGSNGGSSEVNPILNTIQTGSSLRLMLIPTR